MDKETERHIAYTNAMAKKIIAMSKKQKALLLYHQMKNHLESFQDPYTYQKWYWKN